MKRTLIYILIGLSFYACKDKSDLNDPKGSKVAPAQVTNPRVRNISGASIIYYDRPDDNNLKYVKAVYTTDDGVQFDATASFYTDSVMVNGFGTAGEYEVELYSVSAGETMSEPVIVKVNPLEPPFMNAFDDLELFPTFAGIRVSTRNETGAKLSIGTFKKNTAGEWVEIGMHYSVYKNIEFSVRGQDTIIAEFGAKVRDRWGHWSGMKTITTTPWYEEECSKSKFKEVVNLPSDTRAQHTWSGSITSFAALWDNQIWKNVSRCFHTKSTDPMPQHITIDLGNVYSLSRLLVWGRGQSTNMGASSNNWTYTFKSGYPERVQLYGSSELENVSRLDDDIMADSWILLGDFYLKRADGSIDNQDKVALTDEDKALLERGQELIIPDGAPKVRFIRFRTMSTYGSINSVMLDEFSFFGSDK